MQPQITITYQNQEDLQKAKNIAAQYNFAISASPIMPDYYLLVKEGILSLIVNHINNKPLVVNFNDQKASHRRHQNSTELIGRAIGLKKQKNPLVIDGTAGLGRDSFVLASLGCTVQMFERNTILSALLSDGITRGNIDPEVNEITRRMTLSNQETPMTA